MVSLLFREDLTTLQRIAKGEAGKIGFDMKHCEVRSRIERQAKTNGKSHGKVLERVPGAWHSEGQG